MGSSTTLRFSSDRRRAVGRSTWIIIAATATVALLAGITLLGASPGAQSSTVHRPECDSALSSGVGIPASSICLEDVEVSLLPTNSSDFSVPVMVMKPGTTTTVELLYLLSAESSGHTGPMENVTASDLPVALSVPGGKASDVVTFSNASVLFADRSVILYSYTLTAPAGSGGYYAILPPYYSGAYPALAVGADPKHLNATALSTWGYNGGMETAEFSLPSLVVGTGNLDVVNATVPASQNCMNPACIIISHSGF
jgi:hypothetical protein